jgi:hypothetical protein
MSQDFQFLLYTTPNSDVKVNAIIKDETIWLTQKAMAQLFGVQVPAISKHLKNIFEEGELREDVVVSKMEVTTQHGAIADKTQVKDANFYNLDAIISVGYRVNSSKATQFRIWATNVLKEFVNSVTTHCHTVGVTLHKVAGASIQDSATTCGMTAGVK